VIIVLAVAVLVILILGFTIGWNKFLPFIKTNNVQDIVTACSTACSIGSQFDYCTTPRDLKNGTAEFTNNCYNFANKPEYSRYAIAKCSAITCTPAA
jgi:hypothetical protein